MSRAKKSNNRPLFLSIISITLCIVILVGTTLAWFTDSTTNTGNKIQAGTLDIDVVWYELDQTNSSSQQYSINETDYYFSDSPNDFEEAGAMISDDNWEPGDINAKLIEVTNSGTLDVDLQLNAVVTDLGLQDALWYDFLLVDSQETLQGTFEQRAMSTLSDFVSAKTFELDAATDGTTSNLKYILIYGMSESAGNTYNNTSYQADIILTATQRGESNSVVYANDIDDIKNAEANQTVILMKDITDLDADIKLTKHLNFDLNGYTLMVDSFSMSTDAYCTVDFENGEIWVQTGDVEVYVPNGTVNLIDVNFVLPITNIINDDAIANVLNFTVSEHTLTTTGDVYVYNVTPAAMGYVADGTMTAENLLETSSKTGTMTVNDGVQAIINEGSTVYANLDAKSDDYVLVLNGTITGTTTGATNEDGVTAITSAQALYDFMTSTNADDDKAVLACDITYDTDNDGVMSVTSTKDLNLSGYTITIQNDTSDDATGSASNSSNTAYPIKMGKNGDLTIYGGTFIAGMPDDSGSTEVGAMGAIGYSSYNDATLNVYDMTFYNAYEGYPCIQAYEMGTVTITDCIFNSYYGNAVKSACSDVVINNCTVYQDPNVSYGSNFFAVQWEEYGTTTLTVNGGTYSGNAYGLYVYSTGGTINVTDGTFTAETVLIASYSSAGSTINVYGGTFDGAISIATGAYLNIYGGTFSNTGLTFTAFSAYVPTGYTATEISEGVYTVTAN